MTASIRAEFHRLITKIRHVLTSSARQGMVADAMLATLHIKSSAMVGKPKDYARQCSPPNTKLDIAIRTRT